MYGAKKLVPTDDDTNGARGWEGGNVLVFDISTDCYVEGSEGERRSKVERLK